jgi:hypothetical protein
VFLIGLLFAGEDRGDERERCHGDDLQTRERETTG